MAAEECDKNGKINQENILYDNKNGRPFCPDNLRQIQFLDLSSEKSSYCDVFILGQIFKIWPIQRRGKNNYLRKLIISEDNENSFKNLVVFLFDSFAVGSDFLKCEDYIALTDFRVENLTCSASDAQQNQLLPFQILLESFPNSNPEVEGPYLWITRRATREVTKRVIQEKESELKNIKRTKVNTKCTVENESYQHGNEEPSRIVPEHLMHIQTNKEELTIKGLPGRRLQRYELRATYYSYVTLKQLEMDCNSLVNDGQKYNIYALVQQCLMKTAQISNKPYMELVLRDPTLDGMVCVVIGHIGQAFPDIHAGDIVRIHRLQVDRYRNSVKGKCFSPKDILVFSGVCGSSSSPRSVAATYSYAEHDQKKVEELREFASTSEKTMEPGDFADIVCQVVSVASIKKGQIVVLRVWNGTKPFDNIQACDSIAVVLKTDSLLEKQAKNYMFEVWAYDCHSVSAETLEPGEFVELKNVHLYCLRYQGEPTDNCRLCLHAGYSYGRGITVLSPSSRLVKELKQALGQLKRLNNESTDNITEEVEVGGRQCIEILPESGPTKPVRKWKIQKKVTEITKYQSLEPVLIKDILVTASPGVFKVRGFVVGFDPPVDPLEEFLHLYCPVCNYISEDIKLNIGHFQEENGVHLYSCPECASVPSTSSSAVKPLPQLEYTFLLKLQLRDKSGQLEAFLWEKHAENFFGGMKPHELLQSDTSVCKIRQYLQKICIRSNSKSTSENKSQTFPLLECIIVSYKSTSNIRHAIQHTALKLELLQ